MRQVLRVSASARVSGRTQAQLHIQRRKRKRSATRHFRHGEGELADDGVDVVRALGGVARVALHA